ncbi:hypothetical protein BU15DRAFT_17332, partial [Melanogaster broomeanus]
LTFPFSHLSIELALNIIELAAIPDFYSTSPANPYACALALSRVSKAVRRATLPVMLHTVLLPRRRRVVKFVAALRIQSGFALANRPLFVDYATSIHRIMIGPCPDPPPSAPMASRFFRASSRESIDFSLLAPVLLSAPSLALDFQSALLLCDCLNWAWQHHGPGSGEDGVGMGASLQRSRSPLAHRPRFTLLGSAARWRPFTSTPEGSAFLASLSHLLILPKYMETQDLQQIEKTVTVRSRIIPRSVNSNSGIPWASLRSLQRLTVPL